MDVSFDQYFLSSNNGSDNEFADNQTVKQLGCYGGTHGSTTEATGDIVNITEPSVSHWVLSKLLIQNMMFKGVALWT